MKSLISTSLLLALTFTSFAQKSLRDSLTSELNRSKVVDSAYVDLLNALSFEYIKLEPPKSIAFINEAIRISDSLNYNSGKVRAITNKGNSYWVVGLYDQALSQYLMALNASNKQEPINIARLYNNIGEVYKKKILLDSAMSYYKKSLQIIEDQRKPPLIYYNIGETLFFKGLADSAHYYFKAAEKYALESHHPRGLAYAYFGLAEVSFNRDEVDQAIELQRRSLNIRNQIDDVRGAIQSYLKLAFYLMSSKNRDDIDNYIQKAKDLTAQVDANDLFLEACYLEYQFLTFTGKYEEANQVLVGYESLKDSLRSYEFSNMVEAIKSSLLAEIKSKENQLLIEENRNIARINRSRTFTIVTVSLIVLFIGWVVYQTRERRQLLRYQKEKDILIDKLTARNKNLQEFNNVISHNLREPLTQIIGYSKFYENNTSNLPNDTIISNIRKAAFKIDQTVRNLSAVLNAKDPSKSDFTKINLEKLINEILRDFHEWNKMDASFDIKVPSVFTIYSYRPHLRDILYQVISNTIRFRKNDVPLEVAITATEDGHDVLVTIVDNGVGLDTSRAGDKIFKMYQKFHYDLAGRGIGLYVVKNKITSLGGTVNIISERDKGTTVELRHPVTLA